MKKIYGYARVSTKDQNLDRQLVALRDFGIDDRDIIREKASGKSLDREAYQTLRNQLLREGDTLVIVSLDRLSRNKLHIKQELEYYRSRNIRVMILDMPTTLCQVNEGQEWIIEMINAILIEVLASMAVLSGKLPAYTDKRSLSTFDLNWRAARWDQNRFGQ